MEQYVLKLYKVCINEPRHEKTNILHMKKNADQLRGNRKADQRLCFHYIDSTIPLISKSEISSLVCVGPGRKPERWFSHVAAQMMTES